ncbi:MAG: hypothetical protein R3B09_26225 [Nannocystaceae bacterium]
MIRDDEGSRTSKRARSIAIRLGRVLACACACAYVGACTPAPEVVDLELADDASCASPAIDGLASLSVEVYGDADGELCTLARRCVTVDAAASIADLEATLAAATQPLVDVELEGARQIAVLGHARLGCGEGDRRLCGFADLADLAGASLPVPIRCDVGEPPTLCPLEVPPFCP